jgi:hypothetical protein
MLQATPPRLTSELTFRGITYTVADRPPGIAIPTRHWWLELHGAWFQVAKRAATPDTLPVEAISAWIYANVLPPHEDPMNDERGPAWTTTESRPIVFIDGDVMFSVWADHGFRPLSPWRAGLHWIVNGSGRRQAYLRLDCGDTVAEVLRGVRSLDH